MDGWVAADLMLKHMIPNVSPWMGVLLQIYNETLDSQGVPLDGWVAANLH